MNGKKGYVVEIKIKEHKGEHLTTVDHIKKTTPEAAAILLIQKYISKKGKKGLVEKLDQMYNEISRTIEIALKIR